MPTGIMRVEKISAEPEISAKGKHYNRGGGYVSVSNPDIDPSRTTDNYSLLGDEVGNLMARVNQRITDGHTAKCKDGSPKPIRRDAVRVIDFVFALSDGETADKLGRDFFEDCRKWVSKVFGAENIVSAVVHLDENTPHLHLAAVPIVNGRLNARALLGGNKMRMRELQNDFYADVCQKRGLERGQPVEETKRRHLSVTEYKRQCEELDVVKQVKAIKPGLTGKTVAVPVGLHAEVCAIALNHVRRIALEREKRLEEARRREKHQIELEQAEKHLEEAKNNIELLKNRVEEAKNDIEQLKNRAKEGQKTYDSICKLLDKSEAVARKMRNERDYWCNLLEKYPDIKEELEFREKQAENNRLAEIRTAEEARKREQAAEAAAKQAAKKIRQKEVVSGVDITDY